MTWTTVLLSFRLGRGRDDYRKCLGRAMGSNPHVAASLVAAGRVPKRPREYAAVGSEDEAINYAHEFLAFWRATPGAIERLYGELLAHRKGASLL